ncbi:DNA endonuclease [Fredinandcohnia salidurans]|uniref:DNA endonuclease n=1 Tax=Fredinandcohnia salidurans TaxID=2595041 RepID=A0ABW4MPU2_9BACI
MNLNKLSDVQLNILFGSIIGDGEITKIYKGSRSKNNSFREHFGVQQKEYRKWKMSFLPDLLYLTPKSNTLRSRALPLFTELYPHFYNLDGEKIIPVDLLHKCTLLHFLAIIFMDDGTLSITSRINHNKKLIYLTPNVYLYLQNFHLNQLQILSQHFQKTFKIKFTINKRQDGHGHILRFTSTDNTYDFLEQISPITASCPSMFYKTNWNWRYQKEIHKYQVTYPGYSVLATNSDRNKNYSKTEIKEIIRLKLMGEKDRVIAERVNRSYWSIVYKLKELRKDGHL